MSNLDYIDANLILIRRDERQRHQLGELDSLQESIATLGILNPVIIDEEGYLIAGERRLTAAKRISPTFPVPFRRFSQLNFEQKQLIELEENLKRSDLTWKEEARAYAKLFDILCAQNPNNTIEKTAKQCAVSPQHLGDMIRLARELASLNPLVCSAPNAAQALSKIRRETQRAVDNQMNELFQDLLPEPEQEAPTSYVPSTTEAVLDAASVPAKMPSASSRVIFQADFTDLMVDYTGRKFNFIHCDFPYGINHGESDQGGTSEGNWEGYDDSADVYWKLCQTLAENLDKLALPSCHVVFWLSMKFYSQTVKFFEENTNLSVDPIPLIWMKSDNKGIIRDVRHTPRNVCEYALVMTRGERQIISPIANGYHCPTSKASAIHVSEKPEPMLKHFFRLFIDDASEMLDPTCGSGSAIRAAKALGAKRVLGWELNPTFAEEAQKAYNAQQTLARFTATKKEIPNGQQPTQPDA